MFRKGYLNRVSVMSRTSVEECFILQETQKQAVLSSC